MVDVNLSRELKSFSSNPTEWAISIRERWAERSEHRSKGSHGPDFMPWPPCPYAIDDEWEAKMHEAIGAPWPCPTHDRFEVMWSELITSVQAQVSDVGRGAFGKEGWADGDTALARIVYCMTLHLQPEHLLETGVAAASPPASSSKPSPRTGMAISGASISHRPGSPKSTIRSVWRFLTGFAPHGLTSPARVDEGSAHSCPKSERSTCSYTTAGTLSAT